MISWIQRTFQQHFKIVFAIILAVTVLSFVFTIGSTPGIGRPDRRTVTQDFFGHNLASQEEKDKVGNDAGLSATLKYGGGINPEQLQNYAFQRMAAIHLADVMHIPETTPTELSEYIQTLRVFQGKDGKFDVALYDQYRNSLKSGGPFSQADIVKILSDDVRMSKIEIYLGGPGYVSPSNVADVLVKSDTSWTVSTATVDFTGFETGLKLSEAQIAKFFADNPSRYTVAPRVSADYVNFPAEAYVAQATATDAEVRDYYYANAAKFPNPARSKTPGAKADPAADFAAVQSGVKAALLFEKAKQAAVKAASDLAYGLFEGKVANGPALDAFLADRKVKTASLAPFTLEAGPAELGGSRDVASAAFELNANRYYSEGIPTAGGAVVLFWKESLPSREPLLAEVREKVVADAVEDQRRKDFITFGRTLQASIERKLKAGESFDKAAAEAAEPVKVDVKSYPAFTLRSMPQGASPGLFNALENLPKGGVSAMESTGDTGLIAYAADKKAPAADPSNPRFMQIWTQLAMTYARTDSAGLLGNVVDREAKRMDAAAKATP